MSVFLRRYRLVGIAMAILLVGLTFFGTCMSAFAAREAATITVNGNGQAYKAVRLLNLTTSEKESGEGWNYSYSINEDTSKYVLGALADMGKLTNDEKAAVEAASPSAAQQALIDDVKSRVYEIIQGFSSEGMTDEVRLFADCVWARIKADNFPDSIMISAEDHVFSVIDQGYYLIAETEALAENDALSLVMLDTLGQENITVTAKEGVPEMTKTMLDEAGNATDIDDFAVGDVVTYELKGTLPEKYERYKRYKYVFHDTMDAGLSLNADSVKVYLGATGTTELTNPTPSISTTDNADGCTIEVAFANLKENTSLDKDSIIRVQYTATVTEAADRGNPGNKNKAHLEFSTDPYYDGDGDEPTNDTPDEQTVAITYDFIFNKVDEAGSPLKGATFVLQKQTADGWVDMAAPTGTDPQFIFGGKDVGTYRLIETKAPDGYMPMQDITFTVESVLISGVTQELWPVDMYGINITHNIDNTDVTTDVTGMTAQPAVRLAELVVKDKDGNPFADNFFTINLDEGSISADIKNNPGSELPGTGGSGVYGFYVTGAVLVFGTVVAVICAKRKKKNA